MNLKYLKAPLYPAIIKIFLSLAMILSSNMASFASTKITPPTSDTVSGVKNSANLLGKHMSNNSQDHHYKEITESELQRIIDNFPEQDKTALAKIKENIAGWPDEIFAEVRNYNQFLMEANKQAQSRYRKLSPSAKQALQTEEAMKKTISPNTISVLSEIHIESD